MGLACFQLPQETGAGGHRPLPRPQAPAPHVCGALPGPGEPWAGFWERPLTLGSAGREARVCSVVQAVAVSLAECHLRGRGCQVSASCSPAPSSRASANSMDGCKQTSGNLPQSSQPLCGVQQPLSRLQTSAHSVSDSHSRVPTREVTMHVRVTATHMPRATARAKQTTKRQFLDGWENTQIRDPVNRGPASSL